MPSSFARTILEQAFDHDRHGREAEAIPLYRRAIKLGLARRWQLDATICLASSLRNVGKTKQALKAILAAKKLAPHNRAVLLFHCLILHDLGRSAEALSMLAADHMTLARKDSAIREFSRALGHYYQMLPRLEV